MLKALKSFIPKRISNKTVLAVYDWIRKLSRVHDRDIQKHRECNREIFADALQSPLKASAGFIENQPEWGNIQIGCGKNATMQKSGCGVIAVYNALYAINKKADAETMLELIARFEKRGLVCKGRLGVSPRAIYAYLREAGMDVHMVLSKEMEDINRALRDYEVCIVTAYNDKSDITRQIHTVCITKNDREEYFAHNTFHQKGNRYIAIPAGEKGFRSWQETIEHLAENPSPLCVMGINPAKQPG